MSVEMDTALAGMDPGDANPASKRGAHGPRPLVMACERCDKRIRGSGAGFAAVDLREASAAAQGDLVTVDGLAVRAPWSVWHAHCAPWALKPLNPYFRIWRERIGTVDDLLDAVAELSRLPWFGATDWGGLVRRILADTDTDAAADDTATRSAARKAVAERRSRGQLPPDDPCHGTLNGYANYGCRCDRCKAVNAQRGRQERANAPQGDQHNDARTMSRAGAVDSPAKRTQTGTDT